MRNLEREFLRNLCESKNKRPEFYKHRLYQRYITTYVRAVAHAAVCLYAETKNEDYAQLLKEIAGMYYINNSGTLTRRWNDDHACETMNAILETLFEEKSQEKIIKIINEQ